MASTGLNVRSLASMYGQQSVGGRVDFRGDPSSLHGAAERNRFRNRSRDRAERASSTPQVIRSAPAGRMEGVEWMDALTSLTERVSTIERAQRAAAQKSVTTTEQLNYLNTSLVKATDDIVEYKAYVEKVFSHIKPYVSSSVEEVKIFRVLSTASLRFTPRNSHCSKGHSTLSWRTCQTSHRDST